MTRSRREFLTHSTLAVLGAVAVRSSLPQKADEQTPGAPPAFGTSPPVGPEVSPETFTQAEKLVQTELSAAELDLAARTWRTNLAAVYERRTGPKKVSLPASVAPASRWNPLLPGEKTHPQRDQFILTPVDPGALPAKDEDIAFAPVTQLSRWIEMRKLTSERLTQIYLDASGAVRSQAALRDHADARAGAGAGQTSGRGDCGREVSRAAAWHSLGREGPAGHRRAFGRPMARNRSAIACRPRTPRW